MLGDRWNRYSGLWGSAVMSNFENWRNQYRSTVPATSVPVRRYRCYSDSGHAWLAVKVADLVDLGIDDRISRCSFVRGATAYLECDLDAGVFVAAYRDRYLCDPVTVAGKFAERSPIRSYARYLGAAQ